MFNHRSIQRLTKFILIATATWLVIITWTPMQHLQNSRPESNGWHEVDIVLAGNTLEGGGGLIRDSLTYSTILGKSIRIESIRADRPDVGGLRVEHTVAIDTIAHLCNAVVVGNLPESRTLSYTPYHVEKRGKVLPNEQLHLDLEGAASISLIALLPYLLFSHLSPAPDAGYYIAKEGINLTITAGTLAVKAPSYYYLDQVLLPTLSLIGLNGHIELSREYRQGWHTQGAKSRGLLKAWVKPLEKPLPAFQLLRRGRVVEITAIGTVPPLEMGMFEQILRDELQSVFQGARKTSENHEPAVKVTVYAANRPAQYHLFLSAHSKDPEAHLGYEQVYPQDDVEFPPELEGNETLKCLHLIRACIKGLVDELSTGSAVDDHVADILTPYQVLAVGESKIGLRSEEGARAKNGIFALGDIGEQYHLTTASLHKETSHWVARQMTEATFKSHGWYESCDGIGLGYDESKHSVL